MKATGEKQSCELRILKGDGSVCWVQADMILATEASPAVLQMVLTEVTQRRQLEASRLQIEGRYRSLIAELQVGVVISLPNSEIVLINQVARDLLDLSEDQLLGLKSFDPQWNVTHEDGSDFPPEQHPAVQVVARCQPVHNETLHGNHAGRHRAQAGPRGSGVVAAGKRSAVEGGAPLGEEQSASHQQPVTTEGQAQCPARHQVGAGRYAGPHPLDGVAV